MTAAAQAAGFLLSGDKVRIETQLRGRENQHSDLAKENIHKTINLIKEKRRLVNLLLLIFLYELIIAFLIRERYSCIMLDIVLII